MIIEQAEKLTDYISGMQSIAKPMSTPIGAIVIEEKDRQETLKTFKGKIFSIMHMNNRHEDLVLQDLFSAVRSSKTAVMNIQNALPAKIYNQLYNIARGQTQVMLAGKKKPDILDSIPFGAKIILVITEQFYENTMWGDLITSVCRLK
jgi:hypothetical protein